LKRPTTVRFDATIEEALQRQAKIENRTVSNLVETAVRAKLQNDGYLGQHFEPTEIKKGMPAKRTIPDRSKLKQNRED